MLVVALVGALAIAPSHFALYKPDGYLSNFVVNGRQKRRHHLLGALGPVPSMQHSLICIANLGMQQAAALVSVPSRLEQPRPECRSRLSVSVPLRPQVDGLWRVR